jgi:hypothetical protein
MPTTPAAALESGPPNGSIGGGSTTVCVAVGSSDSVGGIVRDCVNDAPESDVEIVSDGPDRELVTATVSVTDADAVASSERVGVGSCVGVVDAVAVRVADRLGDHVPDADAVAVRVTDTVAVLVGVAVLEDVAVPVGGGVTVAVTVAVAVKVVVPVGGGEAVAEAVPVPEMDRVAERVVVSVGSRVTVGPGVTVGDKVARDTVSDKEPVTGSDGVRVTDDVAVGRDADPERVADAVPALRESVMDADGVAPLRDTVHDPRDAEGVGVRIVYVCDSCSRDMVSDGVGL